MEHKMAKVNILKHIMSLRPLNKESNFKEKVMSSVQRSLKQKNS